nr:MAG TPA: hypothetical protein [Caudoviricetes sp.]
MFYCYSSLFLLLLAVMAVEIRISAVILPLDFKET